MLYDFNYAILKIKKKHLVAGANIGGQMEGWPYLIMAAIVLLVPYILLNLLIRGFWGIIGTIKKERIAKKHEPEKVDPLPETPAEQLPETPEDQLPEIPKEQW